MCPSCGTYANSADTDNAVVASCAMETRVLIRSGPKHIAAFPYPKDAAEEIRCY